MTVDVRVIAATNRRLDDAVEKGGFRRDLYHRLDVLRIAMPPLRECPEDVVPLVERFLALGNPSLAVPALTPDLIATLRSYPWPGNVRQLRNAAERIAAIGSIWDERRVIDRAAGEKLDFHQAKARLLESFERVYLTELLREHAGNLTRAAAACGLMRHHLRNLLRKYGIDPRGFRTRS